MKTTFARISIAAGSVLILAAGIANAQLATTPSPQRAPMVAQIDPKPKVKLAPFKVICRIWPGDIGVHITLTNYGPGIVPVNTTVHWQIKKVGQKGTYTFTVPLWPKTSITLHYALYPPLPPLTPCEVRRRAVSK